MKIFLFGAPRFERHGKPVHIARRKAVALLAYLAVTRRTYTRDALAALLWPEYEQSSALANLRRELPRLKDSIGEEVLAIDRLSLGINPEAEIWLDTAEFLSLIQQVEGHPHPAGRPCAACIEKLEQAVGLNTEDFMAGFGLPDSPEFDEWQFFQSESLRQSLAGSLQQLISWQSDLGHYPPAMQHARRWLSLDQLHEPAHRRLMQLYALSGQQSAAIRQYQEVVRILQEELGVHPEEETQSLYQAIKSRQLAPTDAAAPAPPGSAPIGSSKPLPSGTISLLFTDIQGSTPLWERFPKAMEAAQNRHTEILYGCAEAHGGQVYKVIGDGLQIAFRTPVDAILAAVAAQRHLFSEDWGEMPALRVRMGIHTGPAELRDGDYVPGLTFFRVSHIMSAGHGGQILISLATTELVRDHLAEEFSLKDLGEYRFKGLSQAEHIFQVAVPDLPRDFPPLAAELGYRHNLPVEVSPFIGREEEVAAVVRLIQDPPQPPLKGGEKRPPLIRGEQRAECRLVTILGPGGVGKSRLALQAARRVLSQYSDGVWYVPLASLSSPEFLVSAVASALNVSFSSQIDLFKQLINHLGQKQMLLVLDNFEHLLPEGVSLPLEILNQTANIRLLITSRERLSLQGEW
ncbi:MAG TPA: BTAD domain-containing putative transcriptional regulator, partial [Anaerolineales bacterium]